MKVLADTGAVEISVPVYLRCSQECSGVQFPVTEYGEGFQQPGVYARSVHNAQVSHGEWKLGELGIYTSCLKKDNAFWGI